MKEKLITDVFILYYLTIYIHLRYYLFAISIRDYDFNKTSSIENKGI